MARLPKSRVIQVQPVEDPLHCLKVIRTTEEMHEMAEEIFVETTADAEDLRKSLKIDLTVQDELPSSQPAGNEEDDEEDDDDDDDDAITGLGWLKILATKMPAKIAKPTHEDVSPLASDRLTPITERSESIFIEENNNSQRSTPRDGTKPKQRKLTSCFGFVATWWARKKEKRRQKKREAIAARAVSPVASLKQFEQKVAKGGVAFTLEVDSRPSSAKPVLPPPRPGTPCVSFHEKMSNASKRRDEKLMKRAQSRTDEKRAEILERKSDIEYGFRTKAELTIIAKQGQARRNRQKQRKPARQGSFSTLGTGSDKSLF